MTGSVYQVGEEDAQMHLLQEVTEALSDQSNAVLVLVLGTTSSEEDGSYKLSIHTVNCTPSSAIGGMKAAIAVCEKYMGDLAPGNDSIN